MSDSQNNLRSYGAGAAGEIPSTHLAATQISLRQKFRYRFDNSLSKGPGAFATWLGMSSILLTSIVALVWQISIPIVDKNFLVGVATRFFDSVNIIFLGNAIPFSNGFERSLAIAFWLIRTAIAGSVIGFITNVIAVRLERLKKGRSPIIESGHTLILGWSSRVFPILQQLSIANENAANPLVVIFSNQDREFMDDEIQSRVGDLGRTRVVTRTGDPTNPRDLERANISGAKSIIVLDADETGDATVVGTVLAVRAINGNSKVSIVAEIDELDHAKALAHATDGQVKAVQSRDVIARVTAQASRQPGLAAVVLDLLDFEGDEIYFQETKSLIGKTYGDALTAFDTSSIIGLQNSDGTVSVNPPINTKISSGDKVIAIAEDDDKVVFNGLREDLKKIKAVTTSTRRSNKPEHILVIGWSEMGQAVISELAQFLPSGSSIKIVANPKLVDVQQLKSLKFGRIRAKFVPHRGDIGDLAAAAKGKKFDEIIVLGYRENISVAEADSHTMMTMLLMNKLFDEAGNGVQPTRLVAEILDSRKAELARVAAVDDLVVSDNLAALMIAQISENPDLAPVFTDLFDAEGASINVKPIGTYTKAKSATYAELVAAARSRGESAIGYRRADFAKNDPTNGVELNPEKSTWYNINPNDALVVIGSIN